MSNILRYTDQVLGNVRDVLFAIKENNGKATTKLVVREQERLCGQYAKDVLNIALMAMGKSAAYTDVKLSPDQLARLAEQAKKSNWDVLGDIKKLREQKGQ